MISLGGRVGLRPTLWSGNCDGRPETHDGSRWQDRCASGFGLDGEPGLKGQA